MSQELVSFVVPTYNGEETIEETLDSILAQNHEEIEVIVVDDGSTDTTVDLVSNYDDDRVRLIRSLQNNGHSLASNIGIANSSGEYLALMDDDIYISPEWTDNLLEKMTELAEDFVLLQPKVIEEDQVSKTERGETQTIQACGLLVKREPIIEIGGYDESYFAWVNDMELGARLINRGYRLYCEPSVEVEHKSKSWAGGELSSIKTYYYIRNYCWYYWRHYDRPSGIARSLWFGIRTLNYARTKGTLGAAIKGALASTKGLKKYLWDEHESQHNLM